MFIYWATMLDDENDVRALTKMHGNSWQRNWVDNNFTHQNLCRMSEMCNNVKILSNQQRTRTLPHSLSLILSLSLLGPQRRSLTAAFSIRNGYTHHRALPCHILNWHRKIVSLHENKLESKSARDSEPFTRQAESSKFILWFGLLRNCLKSRKFFIVQMEMRPFLDGIQWNASLRFSFCCWVHLVKCANVTQTNSRLIWNIQRALV